VVAAREDLRVVAGELAARARVLVEDSQSERAASLVHAAKSALEAAALVDAEPAPILAAADRLIKTLDRIGYDGAEVEAAARFGAAEAVDAVAGMVEGLWRSAQRGEAYARAYDVLRDLCGRLHEDFAGAGSTVADRFAARIATAVQEAEQRITEVAGERIGA